ncbi:hypothetical protein ROZALSC1DRAFT_26625 [Rozella allomycis CSF55]|uniref:Uncharacterized protein n=1 Tax=Rozella allomycis (strain CSF55) TaxID=988480 RepID=A0A4P9YQC7_ROZAC|nr:hypothetical protein ROZALSC1DRAFT_26625 [Rozella allomycis CSF55]
MTVEQVLVLWEEAKSLAFGNATTEEKSTCVLLYLSARCYYSPYFIEGIPKLDNINLNAALEDIKKYFVQDNYQSHDIELYKRDSSFSDSDDDDNIEISRLDIPPVKLKKSRPYTKKWKDFQQVIFAFESILNQFSNDDILINWNTIVPILIQLIDDYVLVNRKIGVSIIHNILKFNVRPLLTRNNISVVFEKSLYPCLTYYKEQRLIEETLNSLLKIIEYTADKATASYYERLDVLFTRVLKDLRVETNIKLCLIYWQLTIKIKDMLGLMIITYFDTLIPLCCNVLLEPDYPNDLCLKCLEFVESIILKYPIE